MDPVDGNAIGGLLADVFGGDMTAAMVTCGSCGSAAPAAALTVWRQAPGTIARCRNCGNLLMVFVRTHGMTCVDLSGVADVS